MPDTGTLQFPHCVIINQFHSIQTLRKLQMSLFCWHNVDFGIFEIWFSDTILSKGKDIKVTQGRSEPLLWQCPTKSNNILAYPHVQTLNWAHAFVLFLPIELTVLVVVVSQRRKPRTPHNSTGGLRELSWQHLTETLFIFLVNRSGIQYSQGKSNAGEDTDGKLWRTVTGVTPLMK